MKLQHPATFDVPELLDIVDTTKLSTFISRVAKYAQQQDPDLYNPLAYMGDCWEVFGEFFFKFFNGDHTLTYTSDYEPNLDVDQGIDGRGISTLDGKPNVIQFKYKKDPNAWITNDENPSNLISEAVSEGVEHNGKNIIYFTSCMGIHKAHTASKYHSINRKEIARRVDGNVVFWDNFKRVIMETTEDIDG